MTDPLRVNQGYLVSKDRGYWAVDTERKLRDAGLEGELKTEVVPSNGSRNWNYLLEDTPTNRRQYEQHHHRTTSR